MIKLKNLLEFSLTKYGSRVGTIKEGKLFASNSIIKKMVYHYTSKSNKEKILQTGFFPKPGGAYGAGIYFSVFKDLFKGHGNVKLNCFIDIKKSIKISDKKSHDKFREYFKKILNIYGKDFDKVWSEIGEQKLSWDTVRIFKKLKYDSVVIGNDAEIVVFESKNIFVVE